MSQSQEHSPSLGTFTVSDMLFFVAACSISALLIRHLRPEDASGFGEYLELAMYCGPAGLALFGPWAVRRQFVDSPREELFSGECLWIILGAAWLVAVPIVMASSIAGVRVLVALLATCIAVPAVVAAILSIAPPRRRPWTHWAGILLCLAQSVPVIGELGPFVWESFERLYWVFEYLTNL